MNFNIKTHIQRALEATVQKKANVNGKKDSATRNTQEGYA